MYVLLIGNICVFTMIRVLYINIVHRRNEELMEKSKSFFRNTIIFTISNFASKFLVFLLLPFYTRVLTPEELGNGDLIVTTTTLLIPILSLCVSEGVLRFTLGIKENRSYVFVHGIKIIIKGFIFLILLFPIISQVSSIKPYLPYFYVLYILTTINQYFNQFTRGLEKIKLIGAIGIVSTIINVTANILFLVVFKLGIEGYLLSFILTNGLSALALYKFGKLYEYLSDFKVEDVNIAKQLRDYNIPLIPNRTSWWIISTFSRYALRYFTGINNVGIFTAANRVPSVITTFYGVVQQALLLSVIDDYEENNTYGFFIKTYRSMDTLLMLLVIFINITIKILADFLFPGSYYEAYKLTPLLVTSVLFGSLHGNLSIIFSAMKNTRILFYNSLIGMILTIILNISLIPLLGIYGAGISNIISYFIIWLHLYLKAKEYVSLSKSFVKDIFSYILIAVQGILIIYGDIEIYYIYSLFILTIIIFIKFDEIKLIMHLVKNIIASKRKPS